MYSIVIILLAALFVIAVIINAIQQYKNNIEAEKRNELNRLKIVIDEAEDTLLAAEYLPISSVMKEIIYKRLINGMSEALKVSPGIPEYQKRISEVQDIKAAHTVTPTDPNNFNFTLPDHEKQIIVLIQGIKRLRMILRSELQKGNIGNDIFSAEDKYLERYQLMVNIETLAKRIQSSLQAQMPGSARQYLEKGIGALKKQASQDDYVIRRKADFENQLANIQEAMRNANQQDTERRIEADKDELDELFAPKKKW
ncbi:hypothetical protein [Neptunicella marina]|uniref:DNA repair protein n=1 Tax=Neptunicella marina TaxID=2125989 RepID=A0A8J6IN85_9ALTE|nr:hypothetical protein [Neptunicella marina]MBC3764446.1 hypothetical protein [Neptunicella marina]